MRGLLLICYLSVVSCLGDPSLGVSYLFRPKSIGWHARSSWAVDTQSNVWFSLDRVSWNPGNIQASNVIQGQNGRFFFPGLTAANSHFHVGGTSELSVVETPEVFTSEVQLISVNGTDWLAAMGRCSSCKTYSLYIAYMKDADKPDFQKVTGDYSQVAWGEVLNDVPRLYAVRLEGSSWRVSASDDFGATWTALYPASAFVFLHPYLLMYSSSSSVVVARDWNDGLGISTDSETFSNAQFSPGLGGSIFYGLESVGNALIGVALNSVPVQVYVSGPEGARYQLLTDAFIHQNGSAFDFDSTSVPGIILSNQDFDYVGGQPTAVKTFRSTNNALAWEPLIGPSGRTLHLYGDSGNQEFSIQAYKWTRFAPGVFVGNGQEGESLDLNPQQAIRSRVQAYLSIDAGLTWRQVLGEPASFGILNFGSLVVFAPTHSLTDRLYYTIDGGVTVLSVDLPSRVLVKRVHASKQGTSALVETTDGSQTLTFGVDFQAALGAECSDSQLEFWLVEEDSLCSLGQLRAYRRKRVDAVCFLSSSFSTTGPVAPCPCTRADYYCDFGATLDASGECHSSLPQSTETPLHCPAGTTWNLSNGYRYLPGDFCDPTQGLALLTQNDCPSGSDTSLSSNLFLWLLVLPIACVLLVAAVYLRLNESARRALCCIPPDRPRLLPDLERLGRANRMERRQRRRQEEREREGDAEERRIEALEHEIPDRRLTIVSYVLTNADGLEEADTAIPEPYVCSITQELMFQPTLTKCGHTFERQALLRWLRKKRVCPECRTRVHRHSLRTNFALKGIILQWAAERLVELTEKYSPQIAEAEAALDLEMEEGEAGDAQEEEEEEEEEDEEEIDLSGSVSRGLPSNVELASLHSSSSDDGEEVHLLRD